MGGGDHDSGGASDLECNLYRASSITPQEPAASPEARCAVCPYHGGGWHLLKPIVILSGPVGAGKSTVAKELALLTPAPVSCIEGDLFWSFLVKPEGTTHSGGFKVIMGSMIAAAIPYARAGIETIVDFSIPPWFLENVRRLTVPRKIPLDFVVLRPSEEVCAFRCSSREEGRIMDYSVYRGFYRDFCENTAHVLADDGASAKHLAARIREGLDRYEFRV